MWWERGPGPEPRGSHVVGVGGRSPGRGSHMTYHMRTDCEQTERHD